MIPCLWLPHVGEPLIKPEEDFLVWCCLQLICRWKKEFRGFHIHPTAPICLFLGSESDPGFPGCSECWHQTLSGEPSCCGLYKRTHAHTHIHTHTQAHRRHPTLYDRLLFCTSQTWTRSLMKSFIKSLTASGRTFRRFVSEVKLSIWVKVTSAGIWTSCIEFTEPNLK